MPYYVVQHIFQGPTNIPRDRSVNTFHFHKVTAGDANFAALALAVSKLYTDGAGAGVDTFINEEWLANGHQIKIYDMAAAKQSPPKYSITLPKLWNNGGDHQKGLPQEVAVCLSYNTQLSVIQQDGPGEENRPEARARGRIYCGPLNVRALYAGNELEVNTSVPAPGLTDALRAGAKGMYAAAFAASCQWGVYSKANTVPGADPWMPVIQQVSTDNAFDTQRRRGVAPTARIKEAVT